MAEVVWSIVVAGGSGARFGGPKQFHDLGGRTVVDWALAATREVSQGVVLVVPSASSIELVDLPHADRPDAIVHGGGTRSESVRCGLAAVPGDATIVVVHDAARPFATASLFDAVVAAVHHGADAAVPGVPVTDTVKEVDEHGLVVRTVDRSRLRAVQTPQAFRAGALRAAHAGGGESTDDAALVEAEGGRVVVVPGEALNRKITMPDDLQWARERILAGEAG